MTASHLILDTADKLFDSEDYSHVSVEVRVHVARLEVAIASASWEGKVRVDIYMSRDTYRDTERYRTELYEHRGDDGWKPMGSSDPNDYESLERAVAQVFLNPLGGRIKPPG